MFEKNLYDIIKAYGQMGSPFARPSSHVDESADSVDIDEMEGIFDSDIKRIRDEYRERGYLDTKENIADIASVIDAGFTVKRSPSRDVAYVVEWENGAGVSEGYELDNDQYDYDTMGQDELEARYEELNNEDIVYDNFCREVRKYLAGLGDVIVEDTRVYCGGCVYEYNPKEKRFSLVDFDEANRYCEHSQGILTIHDEGGFSDMVSEYGVPEELEDIAKKYGYYFERETSWSIGAYKL